MPAAAKIFLSTVSDEFRAYRDQLRSDLTRPNVDVKVQEDFRDQGRGALDALDVYIAGCDAVVHLAGDMTGSPESRRSAPCAPNIPVSPIGCRRSAKRCAAGRNLLYAMGSLACALSWQAPVHCQSGRQRGARPEISG